MLARARIAATLLVGQALGRGAQAVYGVLMVRELSARGYGDFAYVLAVAGILVVCADAGFSRLIIRDVARSPESAQLVREILRVRIFGVFALSAVVAALAGASILPQGSGLWLAAGGYLLAEGLSYGYESAAIGTERPGRFALVQAAGGVSVVMAALLVLSRDDVTPAAAMAGLAAASAVKLAAHRAVWRADGAKARRLGDLPMRRWVHEALPFLLLALLGAVYYRAGVVVLHAIKGPQATAPFAAAMRVFDGVAVLGGVGFAAVSPKISRLHRDRPEELWALWRRMTCLATLVVAPATALLVIGAEPIAQHLFGLRYGDSAGELLAILAPGMGLAVLQSLSGSIVLMSDDRRAVLLLTGFNVTTLLVAVSVLTAMSGGRGAAIGITAAEVLSFTTFALLIRRRHRVPGRTDLPVLNLITILREWDRPRARTGADRLIMLAAALLPLSAAATVDVGFTLTPSYGLSAVAVVVGFPSVLRGALRVPRPVLLAALSVLGIYAAGAIIGSDVGLSSQVGRSHFRDVVYVVDIALGLAVVALLIDVVGRRENPFDVICWFCVGAAVAAAYAIYQWFAQHYGWPGANLNNTVNSDGITTGARDQGAGVFGWERVRGTFKEPLLLASHLAIALPMTFALRDRTTGRRRLVWTGAAGLTLLALGLTGSTLAISCLLVAAMTLGCMWSVQRGRLRLSAVLGVAAAGALLAAPAVFVDPGVLSGVTGRSQTELRLTSDNRLDAWRDAAIQWSERPAIGFGPGQSAVRLAYRPDLGPDVQAPLTFGSAQGLWAASLVDTGLVGFFAWAVFFVLLAGATLTVLRRGAPGLLFACGATGLTATLLGQLSADRLDLRTWFALGLLLATAGLIRNNQASKRDHQAHQTA